jgi:hypothetical protein
VLSQDTTIAMQQDQEYKYSLAAIAKEAKLLKPIELDPAPYTPATTNAWCQYDQLPSMWTVISLIVSAGNTIALMILYRKFNLIVFALSSRPIATLTRQAHTVEAIQLDWTETTPTPQTQSYQSYLSVFSNEIQAIVITSAVLLTIIFMYIAVRLIYYGYKKYTSHKSYIPGNS